MISKIILKPKGPFSLKKIATILKDEIIGDPDIILKDIASIEKANKCNITFIDNKKYLRKLNFTKASACITSKEVFQKYSNNAKLNFLISNNPYLSYAKVLNVFYPHANQLNINGKNNIEVAKTAKISDKAHLKNNISIQDNSKVNSFSSIGPNVYIGKNSYIGNNVSIANTYIGDHVCIQDGSVIGQEGFGYVYDGKEYIKVPQIGIVKIGNNVEIGANCSIDRGSLNYTEINDGVKIDNLVHIAHNVSIGENTMVAGQTGIAGSSKIGKNVLIGGQVGISGHLCIGDNVQIGAQAGVTKNVSKNNIVSGTPSVNLKTYLKQAVLLKKMVERE